MPFDPRDWPPEQPKAPPPRRGMSTREERALLGLLILFVATMLLLPIGGTSLIEIVQAL